MKKQRKSKKQVKREKRLKNEINKGKYTLGSFYINFIIALTVVMFGKRKTLKRESRPEMTSGIEIGITN